MSGVENLIGRRGSVAVKSAEIGRSAEGGRVGLAKRGSRCIHVDGVAYRWVVAPDDGYLVLVVELADAPGQRLEASFRYHDLCEARAAGVLRIVGQRRALRPGVVRAVIQVALSRGWQTSRRGLPAFRVLDAEDRIPL